MGKANTLLLVAVFVGLTALHTEASCTADFQPCIADSECCSEHCITAMCDMINPPDPDDLAAGLGLG